MDVLPPLPAVPSLSSSTPSSKSRRKSISHIAAVPTPSLAIGNCSPTLVIRKSESPLSPAHTSQSYLHHRTTDLSPPTALPDLANDDHDVSTASLPTPSDIPEPVADSTETPRCGAAALTPMDIPRLVPPIAWITLTPPAPPQVVRRSVTCATRRFTISRVLPPSVPSSVRLPHQSPRHPTSCKPQRATSAPLLPRARSYSDPAPRCADGQAFHDSRFFFTPPLCLPSFPEDAVLSEDVPPLKRRTASDRKISFQIEGEADGEQRDETVSMPLGNTVDGKHSTESPFPSIVQEGASSSAIEDLHIIWQTEKARDDLRKYHALQELFNTEVGYLADLRVLVMVYFHLLPTLTSRPITSRASSAFSSRSSSHSALHTHSAGTSLAMTSFATSVHVSQTQSLLHMSSMPKDRDKCYIVNESQMQTVTRNACDLLALHEAFVEELRQSLTAIGFLLDGEVPASGQESEQCLDSSEEGKGSIDDAVRVVATKFATEASRFNIYEEFCVGHSEAQEIIRKAQHQHPVEWDAFERRCASQAVDLNSSTSEEGSQSSSSSHSTSTRLGSDLHPSSGVPPVPSEPRTGRLRITDYLIKPVQRICKYPLLLDQLKPGRALEQLYASHARPRADVNVVLESATQAMHHVASAVDEARHRRDVELQSMLIVSRMNLHDSASNGASGSSQQHHLTASFMASLGACLLAGSLDVVHYNLLKPPSSTLRVKYLAAFLYSGGYLILAKVLKSKVYEPRHWFPLSDVAFADVEDNEGLSPFAFRLLSDSQQLELSASCQAEKQLWVSSLQAALLSHMPEWINEPASSFDTARKALPRRPPSPAETEPPTTSEHAVGLPTIDSLPEGASLSLANQDASVQAGFLHSAFSKDSESKSTLHRSSPTVAAASRRSSTASMKAIFSLDAETITIRRVASAVRVVVDYGLRDVISQPCVRARAQPNGPEDGTVFPGSRSASFRSNSAVSISALTKGKKTDSVRIMRRGSSLLDMADAAHERRGLAKLKSVSKRPPPVKRLSVITAFNFDARTTASSNPSSPGLSSSPLSSPRSPYIIVTGSPQRDVVSTQIRPVDNSWARSPKGSFLKGVKTFFTLRHPSYMSSTLAPDSNSPSPRNSLEKKHPGFLRRLSSRHCASSTSGIYLPDIHAASAAHESTSAQRHEEMNVVKAPHTHAHVNPSDSLISSILIPSRTLSPVIDYESEFPPFFDHSIQISTTR